MSCCTCNCNPCQCVPAAACPCPDTQEYTFENQNVAGVGVFDNETDRLVGFRGILSISNAVIVSLNAANKTIEIELDVSLIVDDLPDATTAQRGVLETATNAEAVAKAATDKILTPSNLAAIGASTTFAGLIEIATDAEAIAGVATGLAIVPSSLAAVVATLNKTRTFADAVARAAAVPDFIGQFGTQIDTVIPYVSSGLGAGNWQPMFRFGTTNEDASGTDIDIRGAATLTIFSSDASGFLTFNDIEITFETGVVLNINGAALQIGGVTVPAASVLTTAGLGAPSSRLLNTFLSTANTQAGWGTPSGALSRLTFASFTGQVISNPPTQAEVQAIDDAVVAVSTRLAALITDLKAVLLPAT